MIGPLAGAVLVIKGAVPITMVKFCVAFAGIPLVAVTVPLYVPAAVGVPDNTPAVLKVRPVGSAPDVTAKVIVVVPVAV